MHADSIYENGRFFTMRHEGESVEAVATFRGAIVATGDKASIRKYRGPRTKVIDCSGGSVFPGFNDPHTHLVGYALSRTHEVNFDSDPVCRSIADVQDRIRSRANELGPGAWILGSQVRDERYKERRYPTRHDLDKAAPNNPVAISGTGSHVVCANSLALQLAGITKDTPDPPGGSIDREADGSPNGILRERGKLGLTQDKGEYSVIPPYSHEERVKALANVQETVLGPAGIASLNIMVVNGEEIRAIYESVRELQLRNRVKLLVRVIESQITLEDLAQIGLQNGFGDDRISIGGVKMSIDGGSLQKNAAMYESYPGEPDNTGLIRIEQDELTATAARAQALGLRNVIHGIGDKAYDMALSAIEEALRDRPRDHRSRIEHLGNLPITREQIARAVSAGVVASPQPQFIWTYGDKWLEIFGEERMQGAFPFRTMLASGLPVIGSSDLGMSPVNPLVGVQAAVTRTTEKGIQIAPEEAISPYEALKMYTSTAAWSDFEEDVAGYIEPQKRADFTVLEEDPQRVPAAEISSIPVMKTVVADEVIYG